MAKKGCKNSETQLNLTGKFTTNVLKWVNRGDNAQKMARNWLKLVKNWQGKDGVA